MFDDNLKWELVSNVSDSSLLCVVVYRAEVPGGWLYLTYLPRSDVASTCFVPKRQEADWTGQVTATYGARVGPVNGAWASVRIYKPGEIRWESLRAQDLREGQVGVARFIVTAGGGWWTFERIDDPKVEIIALVERTANPETLRLCDAVFAGDTEDAYFEVLRRTKIE
jgi:hypothetical protein